MSPGSLPVRVPALSKHNPALTINGAAEYQSMAQIVEDLIPRFKSKDERRFYREVVESYRKAATQLLRL